MSEAHAHQEPQRTEQRRARRYEVSQTAMLALKDTHQVGCEIRDYCAGGMFLRFLHPDLAAGALARRIGEVVEINFTPANDARAPNFLVQGIIRRLAPEGVGVGFVEPPVDALLALQKLRLGEERRRLRKLPASEFSSRLRAVGRMLLHDTLEHSLALADFALPEKLANAALIATNRAEHDALQQTPAQFERQRATLLARTRANLDQRLDHPDSFSVEAIPGSIELALVEETQFEDWLATASEVARLEELFRPQLFDIQPRASHVYGYRYDHTSNPFGPSAICHGFREAFDGLGLPPRARQIAYVALREALAETLGVLYAELLALLPAVELEATVTHPVVASADASSDTQAAPGTLGRITSSLLNFLRGGPAVEPQPMYSAAAPLPDALSSPVLRRLDAAGQLPSLADPVASQSVQMFGALFDTMHAEKSVDEGARPFFKQLEATLMKLALTDPAFLTSPSHPAHKVLNMIDRLSLVAGDEGRIADERLLRLMNRWTDRINAEAGQNPRIFEDASAQLERVVKPLLVERAARVFRLQELCEGRQRAEEIRRGVVARLFERHGDAPLPTLVIDLLNGGWRNILVMAELRGEADADWGTLDQLVVWLAPNCPAPPTADAAQALLRRVDARLTRVCADKNAQDKLLDQLAAGLLDRAPEALATTTLAARLGVAPVAEILGEAQQRMAGRLRVGDWIEFDEHPAPLNLVWSGDEPPVYVFANYRGIKKLDLKRTRLLGALEEGRARWAEDLELPLMDRSYGAMIQKMQRELAWQAAHDPETGLSTGAHFQRELRRAWLRSSERAPGYLFAVIAAAPASDAPAAEPPTAEQRAVVLRALAEALRGALAPDALLGRDGERLIWWQIADDGDTALAKAAALQRFLADKVRAATPPDAALHVAIGLVWRPDCVRAEDYLTRARDAQERSTHAQLGVELDTVALAAEPDAALAEWADTLDRVLTEDRFELICHPVVASANPGAAPTYYELVLHVPPDGARLIPTAEFVTMAERLGRSEELDRRVLRHLFDWARAHPQAADKVAGFACKLSAQALADPRFLDYVAGELAVGGLAPHKLIFSFPESIAIEEHAQTHHFMRQLRRRGCRFMLDNFGGGESSFSYLKSLQLDYLKLDRLLLRDVETSSTDEALVRSVVETANFLGLQTVAGYVETLMLSHKLGELGVALVQGYAIADPKLLEEMAEL